MRSRPYALLILAPVVGYFAALLLVAALVVKPPALGWIGFGVAAAIGLLIGGLAVGVFPHMRANGIRLHPRVRGPLRLLVLADTGCTSAALAAALRGRRGDRAAEVLVVAPVLAAPLHYLFDDEELERGDARARLVDMMQAVARLGLEVHGVVGSDDPLQALGDALATFPANEILLAVPDARHRLWLEQGIEHRARDLYGVHVSTVVTEAAVGHP